MNVLSVREVEQVDGSGAVAAGLATGAAVLGMAGQVARFVPGAQLLSGVLTISGIGFGALATAAAMLDM